MGSTCPDCGFVSDPSYDSCHNRHCPKCPAVAQAKWIAGRLERASPIPLFHVVFLRPLSCAVWPPIRESSTTCLPLCIRHAAPARRGSQASRRRARRDGGVAHTWTHKLEYHPHLHCIVTEVRSARTACRISPAATSSSRPRHRSAVPRKDARRPHAGRLPGTLRIGDPKCFAAPVAGLHRKSWNVYCKRPFGGAAQVITYPRPVALTASPSPTTDFSR
ncbi:MAG: transposase zinc-binding domain-containing protein [Myxococcales bacterium]|nr:transposase zinc-binding domain-containing protein [Myxococcales bacterium]